MKKCFIVFLFTLALLSAIFVFWQPLTLFAGQWYLGRYCEKHLGAELRIAHIDHDNSVWHLQNTQIITRANKRVFAAEKIDIQCGILPFKRKVDLDVTFVRPEFDAQFALPIVQRMLAPAFVKSRWFETKAAISVKEGVIHFGSKAVHFSFGITDDRGHLIAWLQHHHPIEVHFHRNPDNKWVINGCVDTIPFEPIREVAQVFFKELEGWQAVKGTLNGDVSLTLSRRGIVRATGEIALKELEFIHADHEIEGKVHQARLVLHEDRHHILGHITAPEGAFLTDGHKKWEITELDAYTLLDQGVIDKMTLKGNFDGIRGVIECNEETVHLNVKSRIERLVTFIPQAWRSKFKKEVPDEEVSIQAKVTHARVPIDVKGTIAMGSETLAFECDFKEPSHISLNRLFSGADMPIIQHGKFFGQNLPIDTYVAPFLFETDRFTMTGFADVEGTFDNRSMMVQYDVRDFKLDHPNFTIEVDRISTEDIQLPASHYFDFMEGTHYGFVPITNGSYLEKKSGVVFADVKAGVMFENTEINVTEAETFCNEVYFSGGVDVDLGAFRQGCTNVDIHANAIAGTVSQIELLLAQFQYPSFQLPIEGDVVCREQENVIHLTFTPTGFQSDIHLSGALTDGEIALQQEDLAIRELCLDFAYDSETNAFEVSDIQGVLLVGRPHCVEEYDIAGDHIRFIDYAKRHAEFDVWVGDRRRDVVRLVGYTALQSDGERIAFILDEEQTHFGDVHPTSFDLVLKNWTELDAFAVSMNFHLETLLHDLQRFSRTGFLFLSPGLLKTLNDLKTAEGEFKVDVHYDKDRKEFLYHVIGDEVVVDDHYYSHCFLNGKKKRNAWTIDQLQLDHISLSADLLKSDDDWEVNFLGFRYGESLLLGLDGIYSGKDGVFNGNINLLEIDLANLHEWPVFYSFVEEYPLEGDVRAIGKVRLDSREWYADALLDVTTRSCKVRGISVEDAENISCHFVSDKGITARRIKTRLRNDQEESQQVALNFEKVAYDFTLHEFECEGLHFNVPTESLSWVGAKLQRLLPKIITQDVVSVIRTLKTSGSVEGDVSFEVAPPHMGMRLSLADDVYQTHYKLTNFNLEYDPFELKITTQYTLNDHPFWIVARAASQELTSGEVVLSDTYPDEKETGFSPMTFSWVIDNGRFLIQKVEGSFSGMMANLVAFDDTSLAGTMMVDIRKSSQLFPSEVQAKILSWEAGAGYQLEGNWQIAQNWDDVQFDGQIKGRHFELKGYQLQNLLGNLTCSRQGIYLHDAQITDPAGSCQIQAIKIDADGTLSIPYVLVQELRPSMLRELGKPPTPVTPLIVRQLELQNVQGDIADVGSLKATGQLYFTNPPKTTLANILFAIPSEVLSRIGFDLSAMTPIAGTIQYQIQDGKVFLTKFKEMYSQGKSSKFYLPHEMQSYVDFDGNVNVQMRLKQNHALFKFVEPFTIFIRGTWEEPVYSLNRGK